MRHTGLGAAVFRAVFAEVKSLVGYFVPDWHPISDLRCVVFDFAQAQVRGLQEALGEEGALPLIRGCQVPILQMNVAEIC